MLTILEKRSASTPDVQTAEVLDSVGSHGSIGERMSGYGEFHNKLLLELKQKFSLKK